jgi:prolyl oligopeptidase
MPQPDADLPFLDLEADPAAIAAFVAAQNAATDAALAGPARDTDEILVREILEAPDVLRGLSRRAGHVYTFRQTPQNPRGLWLRLPESVPPRPDADWEVVFDVDAHCAATGEVWVWRGAETSAFDPARVLIRLSLEGSDLTRYREFDLGTKAFVAGGFDIGPERGHLAWAGPDAVLWSSARAGDATSAGWPGTIRRLRRGQKPEEAAEDHRTDPGNLLAQAWVTKAGGPDWIEARIVMRAIGKAAITLMRPGKPPLTLDAPSDCTPSFNHSHLAYVAQEEGPHPAGTLVLAPLESGPQRILFRPEPGAAVDSDTLLFTDHRLLWVETRWLEPRLMALDLRDPEAAPQEIAPPVPGQTLSVGFYDANPDAGDGTLALHVSGFLTPPQTWLFDLSKGVADLVFRPLYSQPARFDATGADVHLWKALSKDGTEVPYHIVLPRGHAGRPDLPVLQYGYGGFGVSLGPWYDPITGKLWIERGGAYVMAYIRGGAELGPDWHLQAKGAGRHKAFEDFAAVAEDLVKRGITKPDRIACHGGSNGGLLCGVMLTRYPGHFGAVWASVGVMDMLRFAHFPAGKGWIDEYGDPDRAEDRAWLRTYSPLHNVPQAPLPAALPPALIDTSHRDDRVDPSHSRRFAAALRAAGHAPFYYEHQGGHGGGGASHEKAAEQALGFAFLRHALGVQGPEKRKTA